MELAFLNGMSQPPIIVLVVMSGHTVFARYWCDVVFLENAIS